MEFDARASIPLQGEVIVEGYELSEYGQQVSEYEHPTKSYIFNKLIVSILPFW